jgi:hypothetical protein
VKADRSILGTMLLAAGALLLAGLYVSRRGLDPAATRGLLVGLGLGIVNVVAGGWATARALRRSVAGAVRLMLVGFFVRMVALGGLVLWFQRGDWADATAFALSFLVFFLLFLVFEMRLVMRSTPSVRRPA